MRINALKNEQNVTLILGTDHYQFSGEKAEKVFKLAQKYKKSKTEENLQTLQEAVAAMNIVVHKGLVEEDGNGNYYLKGNREAQMPSSLAEKIIEYAEKDYPTEALINFWKLCMANPNKKARDGFFKYIEDHGITITDKGYAILYKSVDRKEDADDELVNFVSQQYTKVKRQKKAPSNYAVVQVKESDADDAELVYQLVNCYNATTPDDPQKVAGAINDLQSLHDNLDTIIEETDTYYVPHHKGGDYGNKIQLGKPVSMPREECDPNINRGCSVGLHVGARSYVKNFNHGDQKLILACLINPMNIVALPKYNNSKMRTCEYFPYAVMAIGNDKWEEIETGYFEEDYCDWEEENINDMIRNLSVGEDVNASDKDIQECKQRLVSFYDNDEE